VTDKEFLAEGMRKLEQGQYLAAFSNYQKAIEANPSSYVNYWRYYEDCFKDIKMNIASKAFRKDMALCLRKTIEAMQQGVYDDHYIGLRYQELASIYFWNEEYGAAAVAAGENLKSKWNRTESEIYEACSLHALDLDFEQKYDVVSAETIETIRDAICYEYRTEFPGATEDELNQICSIASGELPKELISFYQGIMLQESKELSGVIFLSLKELCKENTTEMPGCKLASLGFFVFAKTNEDGLVFIDLKDKETPIYQCEPALLEGGNIRFTTDEVVELPITYDNVKKVSIKLAMNPIHFYNGVYDCTLSKAGVEACISQYVLARQLENVGFNSLDEAKLEQIVKERESDIEKQLAAIFPDGIPEEEGGMTASERDVVRQLRIADKLLDRLEALTAKLCVEMKPVKKTVGLTDCKVGGVPYIPIGGSYPTNPVTGEKLYLLLQLNFSQMPSIKGYPHKGILQIFISGNEAYGLDFTEPQNQENWRILYHEEGLGALPKEEILAMMPDPSEDDMLDLPLEKVGAEYGLEFALRQMAMAIEDYRFAQTIRDKCSDLLPDELQGIPFYKWSEIDEIVYEVVSDRLRADGYRMGGYPDFINGDVRVDDDETMDYELFLQLDSYGENEEWFVCFGDSGVANFFISPEDLQKKDFSRVLYHWDCY